MLVASANALAEITVQAGSHVWGPDGPRVPLKAWDPQMDELY